MDIGTKMRPQAVEQVGSEGDGKGGVVGQVEVRWAEAVGEVGEAWVGLGEGHGG